MGDNVKTLIAGVVLIGLVTAAFLPGRQTVQGITAGGNAASGFLNTAITG